MKRKLIGVILSDATAEYPRKVLRGIIKQAKEYDYNVSVFSTFIKSEGTFKHGVGEMNIFNLPNYDMFHGIIFMPDSIHLDNVVYEVYDNLKKNCTCPVVCADMTNIDLPHIPTDETEDFKRIVEHFIHEHKFTRINCLTGIKGSFQAELRLLGYKKALEENKIPIDETRIMYGDYWRTSGRVLVDELINSKEPLPEAIVCGNDYMAITVCDALKEKGIRVPEDVCVSGYDNLREANLNTPSITTLRTPLEQIGRSCVQYIHDMTLDVPSRDISILYGDIVYAESCGCKSDLHYDKEVLMREKNYQYEINSIKDEISDMNMMGENLIGVSTIDEFFNRLRDQVFLLKDFKDFFLCLCSNWNEVTDINTEDNYKVVGYSDIMRLEVVYKNREHQSIRQEFHISQMLPELFEMNDTMQTYYFVPVHFEDRCFGYAVITYGDDLKIYDYNFRSWVRNVNSGLEIVRVQNNLRWYHNRLDEIAIRDSLTGIYNRRGLERYSNDIFQNCVDTKSFFILFVSDLDDLKKINDTYGHIHGDKAILAVTKAFQRIKAEDAIFARTGGDEFVLVFRREYTLHEIIRIKESIHEYLHTYSKKHIKGYEVTVSIGVYYGVPDGNMTLSDCHSLADKNMYYEKSNKKLLVNQNYNI